MEEGGQAEKSKSKGVCIKVLTSFSSLVLQSCVDLCFLWAYFAVFILDISMHYFIIIILHYFNKASFGFRVESYHNVIQTQYKIVFIYLSNTVLVSTVLDGSYKIESRIAFVTSSFNSGKMGM